MNCREPGTNPDDWFAVAGSERYLRAKRACYECPLLAPCREYALEEGVPYGIWGGLSKEEREAIWEETGGKPTKFRDDIDGATGLQLRIRREAARSA